jgi:N-methylhydantoinase B/oxoprolinase/acetone carboxylase alpha subunit
VTLGPAGLQVLISRLAGIAEEMGAVLRRAAYSPNIKERVDRSAALLTPDGELLVQAEHIPVDVAGSPILRSCRVSSGWLQPRRV